MKLYEIESKYREAFDSLEIDEATGELIGGFEKLHEIESLEGAYEEKLEAIALYIKEQSALKDAIKIEKDKLSQREKTLSNSIAYFKKMLTDSMNSMGRDKAETPRVKISFRKSEAVNILNEDKIPPEYTVIKITNAPDKTAIKAAIKSGIEIEGAELVVNKNIQIK